MSDERRIIQNPGEERGLPRPIQKIEKIKSQQAPKQYPANNPKPQKD